MSAGTLTRADLTDSVMSELGLGRQDCADLVEGVLSLMCGALEEGEAVKLSGFGVFEVRSKTARMGRNPKTGEPAAIIPRRVMTFRASQLLKGRVARAHAGRALRAVVDG